MHYPDHKRRLSKLVTAGLAGAGCAVVMAGLALVAGGCGSSSTSSESELASGAPLQVGYLASLTGFCSRFALQYVEGAELAVRRIDARGGVLGHRLALIVRDDAATPNVAADQARALVESDHVKFLAGACTSPVGKSVAQLVANPSHVIYVAGVSDPTIFAGGPGIYAFDTIPTTTAEGRNAASYVRAHPRWKRIAVISEAYEYGYQVTAAFERALAGDQPDDEGQADQGRRKRGVLGTRATEDAEMRSPSSSGQVIVSRQYLPAGDGDYTPYIEKLLAAHPDAVYSTVITGDAATLVEQGLPLGLFARTHFLGVMDYATIDAMPKPPVGAAGYTVYPSAAIYNTPYARDLQSLGATVANSGAAGDAFNQIEIIAQGIAKAYSTDPTKVRDALAGATVQTVQGSVQVRKCDHTLTAPIAMGPVVGPTPAQPFVHLEPLKLVGTNKDSEC
jgi:ABC-type branched-subunit amino acid transport system substrate-binding protein